MNACKASPHFPSCAAMAMTVVAIGLFHAGSLSAAGPTGTTFTPSGPITLTSGQVVTGLHITNPGGPCINGSGVTNVRITNNKIGPCGSTDTGVGVNLYQPSGIRVDHNSFDDIASALYVIQGGNDIVFEQNHVTRIRGPLPRGQMVQFNNVRGTGHKVMCNVSDQTTPGYLAGPEDHVSMYASSGTTASPIDIAYNKIRGGGPSQSGGGMLAGDTGSDNVTIRDNILIHPGQYGIAIAGGSNIRLLRNRVYSRTVFPWSNIGAYVWSQYGASCSGNEVRGNHAFYLSRNGVANPYWNAGNCGAVAGESENTWDWGTTTTLTEAMWNEEIPACAESGAAPSAPGNLAATISRTTAPANVNLTWTDSATNETSIIVERAPQNGAFTVVATLAANSTSYVDPNSPGGMWNYRVKARNASGDSGYSNSATVSIALAPASTQMTGTLLPVASGTLRDWNGSSYTRVNEAACDGNGSYGNTTTVGGRVSYRLNLSSIPVGATITKIDIVPCASRHQTGTGSANMDVFHRWNGVNSGNAGGYALTGTTPVGLAAAAFSGMSLARTSGSVLEIGAVLSGGDRGARLSRLAAVITYTAP